MILETLSNGTPMTLCGMATTIPGASIKIADTAYSPNFCYCMYECNDAYPVWGGGTGWQNDKTTFLFRKQISTDTGVFSIWKNGVSVATITDSTYGEWKSSYTSDALQYSFIADWDLIYDAFGYGEYVIKNVYTSIGVASTFESRTFELSLYDDEMANGWIKFDWTQIGLVEGTDFNFTEGIDFSFKMEGTFKRDKPNTVKDSYQTSARESAQFRTEQKNKYLFASKMVKATDLQMVNENMLLCNKITVTDLNLFGTNLKEKDLTFIEVASLDDFLTNRDINISLTFGDFNQDIINTNL